MKTPFLDLWSTANPKPSLTCVCARVRVSRNIENCAFLASPAKPVPTSPVIKIVVFIADPKALIHLYFINKDAKSYLLI